MVRVPSRLVRALVLAISVVSCATGKGLADSGGQRLLGVETLESCRLKYRTRLSVKEPGGQKNMSSLKVSKFSAPQRQGPTVQSCLSWNSLATRLASNSQIGLLLPPEC